MKKLLLLLSVLVVSFVNGQSITPSVNSLGYTAYLTQNPTDVSQRWNVRCGQTLQIMTNDLDTAFARVSRGTSYGITNGYMPVGSSLGFVNSFLYQVGLATKVTNYISGKDTLWAMFWSKGGDTITIGKKGSVGIKINTDTIKMTSVGKVVAHTSNFIADTNQAFMSTANGKITLRDNASGFADTLTLTKLTAQRQDTIADASGTIPVAARIAQGSLTNNNGTYAWSSIGARTYFSPAPFDSTGTLSAAKLARGYITSTSGASTTITTPTATALATALGGVGRGTTFQFVIDNSAGSNTVTVSLDASIGVLSVLTGGNTLTIASGSIGVFQMCFTSTSAAKIGRIE